MVSEILKDEKIRVVLDKMRATCSVRERCTSEVREKISKLLTNDMVLAVSASAEEVDSEKCGLKTTSMDDGPDGRDISTTAGSDGQIIPTITGFDDKSVDRIRGKIISALIVSLTEDGFLSDSRYAAAFARDKAHLLGWGPQKIRYALLSKKLDEATVNEALALVDDSASVNQLERLLRRKLESLTKKSASHATDTASEARTATPRNAASQTVIREKLIRFALGRGYTLDSTLSALSKLPL